MTPNQRKVKKTAVELETNRFVLEMGEKRVADYTRKGMELERAYQRVKQEMPETRAQARQRAERFLSDQHEQEKLNREIREQAQGRASIRQRMKVSRCT